MDLIPYLRHLLVKYTKHLIALYPTYYILQTKKERTRPDRQVLSALLWVLLSVTLQEGKLLSLTEFLQSQIMRQNQ